jgi:integrase
MDRPVRIGLCALIVVGLVLRDLAEMPDPLSPILALYKALFLVAFSSAARVSELAALVVPPLFSEEGMSLSFSSTFIPKRTRAAAAHSPLAPLVIASLPLADAAVCPVVAMRKYLEFRAAFPRHAEPPLWCHATKNINITPRHLAAWLRAVIAGAYRRAQKAPPLGFTPHSIRAAAASWAWQTNVPLSVILEQCRWAHSSTFTSFYLRRVAQTDGLQQRLKPLAIARML